MREGIKAASRVYLLLVKTTCLIALLLDGLCWHYFSDGFCLLNLNNMDKEKASRSSSEQKERGQEKQKGAPAKSNRQTGGSKRHERDDSNGGAERNTTKKQENSI
jgi:hypothetical protein